MHGIQRTNSYSSLDESLLTGEKAGKIADVAVPEELVPPKDPTGEFSATNVALSVHFFRRSCVRSLCQSWTLLLRIVWGL